MTPGVNRLINRGLSLPFPSRRVYTSQTAHHPHFIIDAQLMTFSPRDSAMPRLRWDLVVRVRQEIEAGRYETPEKWEMALSRLQVELERQAAEGDNQPDW